MSKLKVFLLVTAALLVGAIIATALVWYIVVIKPIKDSQQGLGEKIDAFADVASDVTDSAKDYVGEVLDTKTDTGSAVTPKLGEPITVPIDDLSAAQQAVVKTLGVVEDDVVIITPEMQQCVEGKLGQERVLQIIAGDTPGLKETTQIMTCL